MFGTRARPRRQVAGSGQPNLANKTGCVRVARSRLRIVQGMVQGKPGSLGSLDEHLFTGVDRRIRFSRDVRKEWTKPIVVCRGARREVNVARSQRAPRDRRPDSAQRRAQTLAHGKASFVLAVVRRDNHRISVDADAVCVEPQGPDFIAQDVNVHQGKKTRQPELRKFLSNPARPGSCYTKPEAAAVQSRNPLSSGWSVFPAFCGPRWPRRRAAS